MQLSSTRTVSPSSPNTMPPPGAPGSPCLCRSREASCANIPLCSQRHISAIHPMNPFRKRHFNHSHSWRGTISTHSDEGIPHSPLSLDIILAYDLIALVHPFSACKSYRLILSIRIGASVGSPPSGEGRVSRGSVGGGTNVDSGFSVCSSPAIGREDLDCMINTRNSEQWLIWMA